MAGGQEKQACQLSRRGEHEDCYPRNEQKGLLIFLVV